LDEERSLQEKMGRLDELLSRIWDAAVRIKELEDNSDEQHAIFEHKLQSALRLMVGF
jgi:hypothetical protein